MTLCTPDNLALCDKHRGERVVVSCRLPKDWRRSILNAEGTLLLTDRECTHLEWRTHHAASHHWTPRYPRLWPRPLLHTACGHRAAAGQGLPHRLLIVVVPSCSCSARWAAASALFSTLLARDAEVGLDGGTEYCDGRALG